MSIKTFTISKDDNMYEAFPDVAITSSGKLLCVFLECTHHSDRSYSRVMMSESLDRGKTWSPKTPVTEACDHIEYAVNCPRIQRLPDGRMLMVVDRVFRAEYMREHYVVLYFSSDEGSTWSEPVITPCDGIVPDKVCITATGRWLLSSHYRPIETKELVQRLWYSDDKGLTWHGPVIVGEKPGLNLCEVSIIQVGDKLVGLMRENSGRGYDCYKVISEDDGLTWSPPVEFPLPGCHRPVAGYLNDKHIMITYRFSQGSNGVFGKWTQNFFAAVTDEESILSATRQDAWTRIRPIDYDISERSDTGYSGWVQFDDGEIYIVNYKSGNEINTYVLGYSLMPEDIYKIGLNEDSDQMQYIATPEVLEAKRQRKVAQY